MSLPSSEASVAELILQRGAREVWLDSLDPYYSSALLVALFELLQALPGADDCFAYELIHMLGGAAMAGLLAPEQPRLIMHLKAQTGDCYLLEHPATEEI